MYGTSSSNASSYSGFSLILACHLLNNGFIFIIGISYVFVFCAESRLRTSQGYCIFIISTSLLVHVSLTFVNYFVSANASTHIMTTIDILGYFELCWINCFSLDVCLHLTYMIKKSVVFEFRLVLYFVYASLMTAFVKFFPYMYAEKHVITKSPRLISFASEYAADVYDPEQIISNSNVVYRVVPSLTLISVNLYIYVISVLHLQSHEKEYQKLLVVSGAPQSKRKVAYLNLAVLMGVIGVLELLPLVFPSAYSIMAFELINTVEITAITSIFAYPILKNKNSSNTIDTSAQLYKNAKDYLLILKRTMHERLDAYGEEVAGLSML